MPWRWQLGRTGSDAMTANTQRFTGKAAGYVRYRSEYDPELILPLLRKWCGLRPEWLVADIGMGTGMLAQVFLGNSNKVQGIEPNAEMRGACVARSAQLEVRDGTAEATGLASGSVDLVVVGRALHWFDVDRAFLEFARILKPHGWVAIIAEGRSADGRDENEALEALLMSSTGDGRSTQERYAMYTTLEERFVPGTFLNVGVAGEMQLSWDELRGFVQSLSYAPAENVPRYAQFEADLRGLYEAHAIDGVFRLATRCWVNAGRPRHSATASIR